MYGHDGKQAGLLRRPQNVCNQQRLLSETSERKPVPRILSCLLFKVFVTLLFVRYILLCILKPTEDGNNKQSTVFVLSLYIVY